MTANNFFLFLPHLTHAAIACGLHMANGGLC
jgi:hypothetical protein